MGDPASVVPLETVHVKDSLSYEDVPVEILDCQVRRLRNKEVASVKVRPRFVLMVRGSPLQPLLKPISENRLSLDPRTDHGLWSISVDRGPLYPTSDTNDGRPTLTVVRSTVRRFDRM
ncbi:hypothetical protein MTR67_027893 [Solanum verrucosum]|uniref:Uncharacterized protein n=1 Tax=Solanum verrucosum TaxID=315347 RepID=A0AAF0U0B4_SOLVR|nr:hypothetical protein MTR67_027893 [Solanum verrucosum]